jgi:hypothetical protein
LRPLIAVSFVRLRKATERRTRHHGARHAARRGLDMAKVFRVGVETPPLEKSMFGLTRLRIVEIGVALLLTLAVLILVGLTVFAEDVARIDKIKNGVVPTSASKPRAERRRLGARGRLRSSSRDQLQYCASSKPRSVSAK